MLAPTALGRPILYAGKEVVIHLSCKDFNRNGLESEAWHLHSEGFHNILALTGDYPVGGSQGLAKPVFDIDSVALIDLLGKMNQGLALDSRDPGKKRRLGSTDFFVGAVVTALAAWRTKSLGLSIAAGMVAFWLLRIPF